MTSIRLGATSCVLTIVVCMLMTGCGARAVQTRPAFPDMCLTTASVRVTNAANVAQREAALPDSELETRLALARALIDEAEYGEASEHLAILSRARPYWYSFHQLRAEVALFARGDLWTAREAVDRCLEINDDVYECRVLRGLILSDLGEDEAAIQDLAWVFDVDPTNVENSERYARTLADSGDFASAETVIDAMGWEGQRRISLLLLRATIYESSGRLHEAEMAFQSISDRHTDPRIGARYLEQFLRRQGRDTEADALMRPFDRRPAPVAPPQTGGLPAVRTHAPPG